MCAQNKWLLADFLKLSVLLYKPSPFKKDFFKKIGEWFYVLCWKQQIQIKNNQNKQYESLIFIHLLEILKRKGRILPLVQRHENNVIALDVSIEQHLHVSVRPHRLLDVAGQAVLGVDGHLLEPVDVRRTEEHVSDDS